MREEYLKALRERMAERFRQGLGEVESKPQPQSEAEREERSKRYVELLFKSALRQR
jgi:hypothetical protein